ncbi:MAG: 50S ribosomal protein L18 [Pseudomonadota bacterium]
MTTMLRRRTRVRMQVHRHNKTRRPRLSVFRSRAHIYGQIIDDTKGVTLVSASSLEMTSNAAPAKKTDKKTGTKIVKKTDKPRGGDIAAAGRVGKLLGERAKVVGVSRVVFDRGSYLYHGRVKALAEAARQSGLEF